MPAAPAVAAAATTTKAAAAVAATKAATAAEAATSVAATAERPTASTEEPTTAERPTAATEAAATERPTTAAERPTTAAAEGPAAGGFVPAAEGSRTLGLFAAWATGACAGEAAVPAAPAAGIGKRAFIRGSFVDGLLRDTDWRLGKRLLGRRQVRRNLGH